MPDAFDACGAWKTPSTSVDKMPGLHPQRFWGLPKAPGSPSSLVCEDCPCLSERVQRSQEPWGSVRIRVKGMVLGLATVCTRVSGLSGLVCVAV